MNEKAASPSVSAREETITLPTYPIPAPDIHPMFLEKRNNQGSSGRIYPNPLTDRLSDEKVDKAYKAVFLENEYLQVILLPELGGRIFAGVDKTNGYNFFYRHHAIKPALIGLFGPWISGGVEFNWPQHHRPSTLMPVDYSIENCPDGSRIVWLSEHEPMERTKGMIGVCLRPGKAFLEVKVQLYNRTPLPQTFLWWANVAVHVNDNYQIFFPPDVTWVTYHHRIAMASYPVARGPYLFTDFGDGTDISWYKNTHVPASFFAPESRHEFFGGYDHGRKAGVVYYANPHISTSKKMFTWGRGRFGDYWESNLTDTDGPYIELMAGAYSDNQPDFSWLQPYESKTFSQYWYPVQEIGPAKNANLCAAVNLEIDGRQAKLGVYATEVYAQAQVRLNAGDQVLYQQTIDLAPGAPFVAATSLPEGTDATQLQLRVCTADGQEIICYAPEKRVEKPLPDVVTPPPLPKDIKTTEELYLIGVHLEQYRHATWPPEMYWQEALKRDAGDVRSNNALGLLHLRRSDFARAEGHLRAAIKTLTRWNFNPRDGEPYYNLGLALRYQGRLDEAYAAFYKSIWSYAWQAAGYYALAQIACRRAGFATALAHVEQSLLTNAHNLKARNLKAALLRCLGRFAEAQATARETITLDPLDFWSRNELALILRAQGDAPQAKLCLDELVHLLQGDTQTYLDIAFDYAEAGLWDEAGQLLQRLVEQNGGAGQTYPMALYALGYFAEQKGTVDAAKAYYAQASTAPAGYCFPFRPEEYLALMSAVTANPGDARAFYYLGTLLYEKDRREEAIRHWQTSCDRDPDFALAWRNLGIGYYNIARDPQKARTCYRKAFALSPDDSEILYELDQLLKRTGTLAAERLANLEQHGKLVAERDPLANEVAALHNQLGQYQEALDLLTARHFHPWEGGESTAPHQYATAHLLAGRAALDAGKSAQALSHFEAAGTFPNNVGLGWDQMLPDADIRLWYFTGLAREAVGDAPGAQALFRQAAGAHFDLSPATFYQALALRKLGQEEAAQAKLREMLDHATSEAQKKDIGYPFFGTSIGDFVLLEEDLSKLNRITFTYMAGLAHLGLGHDAEAKKAFQEVLALDINHLEAAEEARRMAAPQPLS